MKKLIALLVLSISAVFAQSAPSLKNEVFGSAGLSFPRTPAITSTFSATAGYGRTVAVESFGSTEVIGTYNFTRQTPTGGVHSFLGGVKQNVVSPLKGVTPFLTLQVGEATLLKKTNFATQVGGGVRFTNVLPKGFGLDLGVTGTKIRDAKPMFAGVSVGISKSF